MTAKEPQENDSLDVETLEASFALVAPQAERLVERFYEELFDRYPAVQPMFAESDMKSQQRKLLAALTLVVANVRNTDALVPALEEMGRRHEGYGAQPDHYVAVASVLISVMAEVAGEQWTDQIQKAWSEALAVIAGVMIGAYGVGAEVDETATAGATGGIERRSVDRPWSAPKNPVSNALESELDPLPKTARER